MATATLKNYRQAPRKVRVVANLVRGKKVPAALSILSFMPKRAAGPLRKVIESALANAGLAGTSGREQYLITEIRVDAGAILKRSMPRSRGRASRINKRTSHVTVVVDTAMPVSKKDEKTVVVKK